MPATGLQSAPGDAPDRQRAASDFAALLAIALATVIFHGLIGNRYGFHRDELQTLHDARHLAWGYVAYPPATPFFGRISLWLFGASLAGFRFFASLAQAAALVLTGWMARELGGGRRAQMIAVLAALPLCLVGGSLMMYVSFDYLCWVLVAYLAIRMLKTGDPRWWVAIGAAIGAGMLSKYAMPFWAAGLGAGLLATRERRLLKSAWLWAGAATALALMAPNLAWQYRHHFIYLDFIRHIHARDIAEGRTRGFLPDQLKITLFAFPLAMAGLWASLAGALGRQYRALGWMYLVPLLLFIVAQGRGYYLVAAYPMLYAAGAAWWERRAAGAAKPGMRRLGWALAIALTFDLGLISALTLPLAPPGTRWFQAANAADHDLREEIGWRELVKTAAQVRDSLPAAERAGVGVLAANYGEAGAIDLYGPRYGLPRAISGINSFRRDGYGNPPPRELIVIGLSRGYAERQFAGCRLTAHTHNRYHLRNEEAGDHPDIFVCQAPRAGWPAFWKKFKYYG